MGLLDSVLGSLMGGNNQQGSASSPLGGVLSSLLGGGGQQAGGLGGALGGAGVAGGLGGILAQLEQAGLGNIAQSWIGTGDNHPISPDQLQSALGTEQTQAMADQAGLSHGDFLSQLSQHLPQAVDGMTPDGQVPNDDGSISV